MKEQIPLIAVYLDNTTNHGWKIIKAKSGTHAEIREWATRSCDGQVIGLAPIDMPNRYMVEKMEDYVLFKMTWC